MSLDQLLERCLKGDFRAIYKLCAVNPNKIKHNVSPKDITSALTKLEKIKESDPLYSQALYLRAVLHHLKNDSSSLTQAIELYTNAANLNNSWAIINLAFLYWKGQHHVQQSNDKAIELFKRAAELNNSYAIYNLAILYWSEPQYHREKAQAIELFKRAAELNNPKAIYTLALRYWNGEHVQQDRDKAIELFKKASKLGDCLATYALANKFKLDQAKVKDGETNLDSASRFFYKAYKQSIFDNLNNFYGRFDNLKHNSLSGLRSLSSQSKNQSENLLARKYLILVYLETNQLEQAKKLYNENPKKLGPLLEKKLISLSNKFSENQELIKPLHEFLARNAGTEISISRLTYHLSVKEALNEDPAEVSNLYIEHERLLKNYLTAADYYKLGNLVLNMIFDGKSKVDKYKRLTQACWFYYQAYQKGDQSLYSLITRLLQERQKTQTSSFYEEHTKDNEEAYNLFTHLQKIREETEQELFQRFEQTQSKVEELRTFIAATTLNQEEKKLARELIDHLNEGFSLKEILTLLPSLLTRLKQHPNGPLYLKLKNMPESNELLLPPLSDETCKKLLKNNVDRGEVIYRALINNAISPNGLKILAKQKEQVLEYVKTLNATQKAHFFSQFNFDKTGDKSPSSIVQYFFVQRGFFKPNIKSGTLKEIYIMKDNLN